MSKWLQVAVPLGLAVVSYLFMDPHNWADVRQGIMLALSVLSAAIFVRLARGMPITNVDFFEVQEIRNLSTSVMMVMRRMIVLVALSFMSIILLVFVGVMFNFIASSSIPDDAKEIAVRLISSFLTFIVSFTLIRAVSVVRGDYDLVVLQSSLMTRAVERKHAKEAACRLDNADKLEPFKQKAGYGKSLPN